MSVFPRQSAVVNPTERSEKKGIEPQVDTSDWQLFKEEKEGVRPGVLSNFYYSPKWYTYNFAGGTRVNIVFTDGGNISTNNLTDPEIHKKLEETENFTKKNRENECKIAILYVGEDDRYSIKGYNTKENFSEKQSCITTLEKLKNQVRSGYTYTYDDGKKIINEYTHPEYKFTITWPEEYRRIYNTFTEGLYHDFCKIHNCLEQDIIDENSICLQSNDKKKSNEEGRCTFGIRTQPLIGQDFEDLIGSTFADEENLHINLANGEWIYLNSSEGPGGTINYYYREPTNTFGLVVRSELPWTTYQEDVKLILGNIKFAH